MSGVPQGHASAPKAVLFTVLGLHICQRAFASLVLQISMHKQGFMHKTKVQLWLNVQALSVPGSHQSASLLLEHQSCYLPCWHLPPFAQPA